MKTKTTTLLILLSFLLTSGFRTSIEGNRFNRMIPHHLIKVQPSSLSEVMKMYPFLHGGYLQPKPG